MNKTENALTVFTNPEFGSVRTVELDGEPWLVGKDVAEALGYAKPENALAAHVDDEENTTTLIQGDGSNYKSKATIINESGLYSLVLSSKLPGAKRFRRWVTSEVLPSISKLPGAKRFRRWVTSEVLPSIRRHGAYMTPDAVQQALADPDFLYRLVTGLRDEHAARLAAEADCLALAEENEAARPKARFADAVADSDRCILVGDLAKLLKQNGLDIGAKRLFARLRGWGTWPSCSSRTGWTSGPSACSPACGPRATSSAAKAQITTCLRKKQWSWACSASRRPASCTPTAASASPRRPRSPARARSISSTGTCTTPTAGEAD